MRPKYLLPLWALLLLGLSGPSIAIAAEPTAEVLKKYFAASPVAPEELAPAEEPTGDLTLPQALLLALRHNPELASFAWEIRAREAAALQAGILPNPELAVEVENFAGSGDLEGFDGAETTLQLSQLIELGGKRGKRTRVAALGVDLAGRDYEGVKLEVYTAAAKAFVRTLAAQQRLSLAQEQTRLAEEVFRAVSDRVAAGKVSPLEKTRAGVVRLSARTSEAARQRELSVARKTLAAVWGSSTPAFAEASGALEELGPIPTLPDSVDLRANPDIARLETEAEQLRAALDLARSERVPDLTVGLGVRNFEETGDNALIFGLSLPIPLFDRNRGGIEEASAAFAGSRFRRRAAEVQARAGLEESYQKLTGAYAEAGALVDEILPAAQSAFEAADYGYRQGKFGFLDVLDAQRTLFELRGQYVEALSAYHQAIIEIEGLLGRPLDADNRSDNLQTLRGSL